MRATGEPQRVLIVVGSLVRGGGERQALLTARALDAIGVQVAVHVTRQPLSLLEDGLGAGLKVFTPRKRASLLHELASLQTSLDEWRPHVVVTFMASASARMLLLRAASRAARDTKWVVSERGNIEFRSFRMAPFAAFMRLAAIRRSDHVVVNAASLAGNVMAYAGEVAHKVAIIPNVLEPFPVDVAEARAKVVALLGRSPAFPSLLAIGSFQRARNYQGLARALVRVVDEFPSAHLTICGRIEGPDCEPEAVQFRETVKELGLTQHVTVLGEVQDARRLIPAFDAFVLASKLEGSSNGLAEALYAGTPMATAPVGDAAEAIAGAGVVASGWAPAALAEAITTVLRDHERWRAAARERSASLREARHPAVVARAWQNLFRRLGTDA